MDISSVSARLEGFEPPLFRVPIVPCLKMPFFSRQSSPVLPQNHIQSFGAEFVGYHQSALRCPFYAEKGADNILDKYPAKFD